MLEKVCIYVDGGNFYHLVLKKLGIDELQFDFDKFVNFLADGRSIPEMSKRFYIGTVREKEGDLRSKAAMSKQRRLFSALISTKLEIKTSKLQTRIEEILIDQRVKDHEKLRKAGINSIVIERLREKGIEVKIATDLIVGAVDNKYDTAIIISSDSDLIPAIDWVRYKRKKKIEYIGFSIPDKKNSYNNTRPLVSMISRTDVQRIFSDLDLKSFIKP